MNVKPVLIVLEPNPELRHEFNTLRDQFVVHTAATPPLACVDLINSGGTVLVVDSGNNPGRAALQVQFFREYIANLAKPDISILVIVNCPLLAIEKLALRCGADGVLARPFTSAQLSKAVKDTLRNRETASVEEPPAAPESSDSANEQEAFERLSHDRAARSALIGSF